MDILGLRQAVNIGRRKSRRLVADLLTVWPADHFMWSTALPDIVSISLFFKVNYFLLRKGTEQTIATRHLYLIASIL